MKLQSIIQRFPICVAFLTFVILSLGCSVAPIRRTYNGDKLQKSEVAVIKGFWLFALLGYEGIDIYTLDGDELRATKVEVLPGFHSMLIRNYSFSFVAPIGASPRLAGASFYFEAGHEYKIKYWFKGIVIEGVRIIDVTSGALISESRFP